jgi:hypothetical protein
MVPWHTEYLLCCALRVRIKEGVLVKEAMNGMKRQYASCGISR